MLVNKIKKTLRTQLFLLILLPLLNPSDTFGFSIKPKLPFYLYYDAYRFDLTEYYIPSGWSGDVLNLIFEIDCKNNPQSGETCLKVTYEINNKCFFDWAGITWQYPSCNWGNIDGGLDLTEASELTFWARGETGYEGVFFTVGGCYGVFSDTAQLILGPLRLSQKWQKYTIPFNNEDRSHICWGFSFYVNKQLQKSKKVIFYLDNIQIEKRKSVNESTK